MTENTMIEFTKVIEKDFPDLATLAKRLWHCAFDNLIGKAQADYMIEKFQSETAFFRQTQSEGYAYYFIKHENKNVGYTAIANRKGEGRLFLSKLYLAPEVQGMGIAVKTLNFILEKTKELKKRAVYLTVNKGNARAIAVYEKFGFNRIDAVVTDIGNGFVMDDYIYQYDIK